MVDFEPTLLASVPHIVFLIVSAVTLLGAIAMVTVRSIVYAALMMIVSFAGVAGIYVLLEAPFLAAVQVLIYIGAISVLFLFGIMLTQRSVQGPARMRNQQWAYVFGAITVLAAVFPLLLVRADWVVSDAPPLADPIRGLGEALLTTYVLPFEVASVLLLMALVGAIIIAREGVAESESDEAKTPLQPAGSTADSDPPSQRSRTSDASREQDQGAAPTRPAGDIS